MVFCCALILLKIVLSEFVDCNINLNFSWTSTKNNFLAELQGQINDSPCSVEEVNQFNNAKIYPRISSIVMKDYFKFYKVNLKKDCPYWNDASRCAMRYCQVESCDEKDVPLGIKNKRRIHHGHEDLTLKYLESSQEIDCEDEHSELGYLNTTISAQAMEEFALWQKYDDAQDMFCTLPDEDGNAQYVDLSLNPERYTGYRGPSAHKIWRVIYKENCFRPENIYEVYIRSSKLSGMCIEKRAFYRAISGLHASINIHLCAKYLLSDKKPSMMLNQCNTGQWGHNVEEFQRRFSLETTEGEGLQWLQNLYFLYLVELRALAKVSAHLEKEEFYTGNDKEDTETQCAVKDLLNVVKSFPNHFNESEMFSKGSEATQLKEEFRRHFRNISTIMDCVGCDKCRLWGKLQTQGLGTAFKILFSAKLIDKEIPVESSVSFSRRGSFRLERSEIVALLNGFARLSTSIYELETFGRLCS